MPPVMLIIPPSAPPLHGHGVSAAKNPALPFEPLRFAHNDRAAEIRAERPPPRSTTATNAMLIPAPNNKKPTGKPKEALEDLVL